MASADLPTAVGPAMTTILCDMPPALGFSPRDGLSAPVENRQAVIKALDLELPRSTSSTQGTANAALL